MSTQHAGPKSDPRLQSGVPAQAVGQTAGHYATKPKPIIAGESQAQGIAMFSYRASYEDLTPERRERLKVSVSILWHARSTLSARLRRWPVWNRPNSSAVRTRNAL